MYFMEGYSVINYRTLLPVPYSITSKSNRMLFNIEQIAPLVPSTILESSRVPNWDYLETEGGTCPMLPIRREPWGESRSRELEMQRVPARAVAAAEVARWNETAGVIPARAVPQFRHRILVLDDDPSIRETAQLVLGNQGYEVLTVADGLEGLEALSKSLPDVIISDLNMPRMSGLEFLAIVRKRFPHIATIAMSGEFVAGQNPSGILADAFLPKGQPSKRLFQEIAEILAASPIRAGKEKSAIAPLFVKRDETGYLVVSCSKCLRFNKLEAKSLNGGIHETLCESCSSPVRFEIDHEGQPL
jgi:CheY-like chemotaxis protein